MFSVGDRVKLVDNSGTGWILGATGTVTDARHGYIHLKWDASGREDGGWYDSRFELVERPPFVVGERVRTQDIPGNSEMLHPRGSAATITEVYKLEESNEWFVRVKWDNESYNTNRVASHYAWRFEKMEKGMNKWIVYRKSNDLKDVWAFDTEDAALIWAKKTAEKTPGDIYIVARINYTVQMPRAEAHVTDLRSTK